MARFLALDFASKAEACFRFASSEEVSGSFLQHSVEADQMLRATP
jgi:hypothetical protein